MMGRRHVVSGGGDGGIIPPRGSRGPARAGLRPHRGGCDWYCLTANLPLGDYVDQHQDDDKRGC